MPGLVTKLHLALTASLILTAGGVDFNVHDVVKHSLEVDSESNSKEKQKNEGERKKGVDSNSENEASSSVDTNTDTRNNNGGNSNNGHDSVSNKEDKNGFSGSDKGVVNTSDNNGVSNVRDGNGKINRRDTEISKPAAEVNLGTFQATMYTADCTGCSGITRYGINVNSTIYAPGGLRVIAVDPAVIEPMSTVKVTMPSGRSFIAIAGDTGGAIEGREIDILVADRQKALNFGRKTVTITELN